MGLIDALSGKLSDSSLPKYKDQNYDKIKKQCLKAGEGWTDPEFGPNDTSLWEGNPKKEIEWKRVHEISPEAMLFVGGHCEDDVKQGGIGNCWFVASVACFALHDELVKEVIPHQEKQELNSEDHAGILLFRFYRFGEWVEVVVDDYLPTKNGRLAFMHSADPNEFWCAFLEKAYAKLAGSYEALDSGSSADALSDLTGGVSQYVDFKKANIHDDEEARAELFKDLHKALSRDSLVNASMVIQAGEGSESKRDNGLIVGHAYTIIRCYELSLGFLGMDGKHKLVKIRNPWGDTEWKGKWSDDDPKWGEISDSQKKELDFSNEDDGEFWMEYNDVVANFDNVTLCRIINTDVSLLRKKWHMKEIRGAWVAGETAGGCANNPQSYFTNPQVQFVILEEDDETVQIVLEQRDLRIEDRENLTIGYRIFKVPDGNTGKLASKRGSSTAGKTKYTNTRQIYGKFKLEIGTYVVIPSTFEQDVEGDFLIKIFTEDEANVVELE
ncbi:calpain-5-like [Bolinopsis microptera]|uniref:calpain-5-like n=1 Tax=Bolinopsis microptera TaxID=2820187 RepID=UPI00307AC1DF